MTAGARQSAPMPRAVTFDLWFTLVYQTRPDREAYEAARKTVWEAAWGDPPLRPGLVDAFLSRHGRESDRREGEGRSWPLVDQARWAGRLLRRPVDAGVLQRRMGRALASASVRVAPGALVMLDRLAESGVRTAIVSNIVHEPPRAVRRRLEGLHLSDRMSAVVLSAEVGSAKPSPGPMLRALRDLDCPSDLALHIGDLPGDRAAAWSAGMPAARFTGLARWRPPRERRAVAGDRHRIPSVARWEGLADRLPGLLKRARAALP